MTWLRSIGAWLRRVGRRLLRRSPRPDEGQSAGDVPQADSDFQRQIDWYVGVDLRPSDSGGGFSAADLMLQTAPPRPHFRHGDLLTVGTARDKPRLDPRRLAAIEQRLEIDGGVVAAWRGGTHGNVVQIAGGREAVVLTQPVLRRTAEHALQRLVGARDDVERALESSAAAVDLRWPEEVLVGYDGGVEGYISASLGEEYIEDIRKVGPAIRTLSTIAMDPRSDDGEVSADERLSLVTNVGTWIGALHDQNVVYGQLSPAGVAFRRSDMGITPVDYVAARVMGCGPWAGPHIATSMDDDRRALAALAMLVLIPESEGNLRNFFGFKEIDGLGKLATARVRWLLARASGIKGMPTVDEWLKVLRDPER